jgi:glycosyltransferase involved in cell wall biosynthesis
MSVGDAIVTSRRGRPQRILHLLDSYQMGGTEEVVLTLLSGLKAIGWNPLLCCSDDPGVAAVRESASHRGIEYTTMPSSRGRSGLQIGRAFYGLSRRVLPDLLHVHLNWPLAVRQQVVAARIAGVRRIVATSHLVTELDGLKSRGLHAVQSRLIDRYVAVSSAVKDRLCKSLAVPTRKVVVVHNGVEVAAPPDIDVGAVRRELVGPDERRRIAFTPARLHEQKGHAFLIRAAVSLPDVVFLLAGTGPAEAELRALAARLGVAERVRFLGFQTDVPKILAACDLFVLPSLYEGLPITVLEAMAAGKPIVATAVDGTKEALVDGESGLVVPARDPVALAAAISRLTSDAELASRLARAARIRVEREFSGRQMAAGVSAIYDTLLS